MTFKNAQDVISTIDAGREVARIQSGNRAKVDGGCNGDPSLSDDEAKKWGLQNNINWGEMPVLFSHAKRQYTKAYNDPPRAFSVTVPLMPQENKADWEMFITDFITGKLKDSREYFYLKDSQHNDLVKHGMAPTIWENKDSWMRKNISLRDFRVPTDSQVSMANWEWFAVRDRYTEGQLYEKVYGEDADEDWNKGAIAKILDQIHPKNYDTSQDTWTANPEAMVSLMKQNGLFFSNDAVPTVPMWRFYFKQRVPGSKKVKWLLRVVSDPEAGTQGAPPNEFLYDSGDKSMADDLSQLLSVQFGDLNTSSPSLVQEVRGLGFLILEPCIWSNLTFGRMVQAWWESCNIWLRVNDPAGRARAQKVELFNKCIIDEGVSIVGQNERHQPNVQLGEMIQAHFKQLQGEASSSYTQQTDNGTAREQTAYETSVKVAQVNAMTTGILLVSFIIERGAYREICRRFCLRDSEDEDVREFQRQAKRRGIPEMWLNTDLWKIEPEVPLGGGNPTMEVSMAKELMGMIGMFSPSTQEKVKHAAVLAITKNSATAENYVPLKNKPLADDGMKWATAIFGTMMAGVPVGPNDSVSALQQIGPLIGMMAAVVQRIEANGNLGTAPELTGLHTVEQYVRGLIGQIAQDKSNEPAVKQFTNDLNQLSNLLKGFDQRLAQQQQQQDPEALKAQFEQQKFELEKARFAMEQQKSQFDLAIKAKEAQLDEAIRKAEFLAQQQRDNAETEASIRRGESETAATIQQGHAQTQAQIEDARKKSDAQVEATKKQAEAKPKENAVE